MKHREAFVLEMLNADTFNIENVPRILEVDCLFRMQRMASC